MVETDVKAGKVALVFGLYCSDLLFGRHTILLGFQHDGGAVGIIGTNVVALVPHRALETYPNIGLDVLNKVAQMNRTIGIRKSASNKQTTGHGAFCT